MGDERRPHAKKKPPRLADGAAHFEAEFVCLISSSGLRRARRGQSSAWPNSAPSGGPSSAAAGGGSCVTSSTWRAPCWNLERPVPRMSPRIFTLHSVRSANNGSRRWQRAFAAWPRSPWSAAPRSSSSPRPAPGRPPRWRSHLAPLATRGMARVRQTRVRWAGARVAPRGRLQGSRRAMRCTWPLSSGTNRPERIRRPTLCGEMLQWLATRP